MANLWASSLHPSSKATRTRSFGTVTGRKGPKAPHVLPALTHDSASDLDNPRD